MSAPSDTFGVENWIKNNVMATGRLRDLYASYATRMADVKSLPNESVVVFVKLAGRTKVLYHFSGKHIDDATKNVLGDMFVKDDVGYIRSQAGDFTKKNHFDIVASHSTAVAHFGGLKFDNFDGCAEKKMMSVVMLFKSKIQKNSMGAFRFYTSNGQRAVTFVPPCVSCIFVINSHKNLFA